MRNDISRAKNLGVSKENRQKNPLWIKRKTKTYCFLRETVRRIAVCNYVRESFPASLPGVPIVPTFPNR